MLWRNALYSACSCACTSLTKSSAVSYLSIAVLYQTAVTVWYRTTCSLPWLLLIEQPARCRSKGSTSNQFSAATRLVEDEVHWFEQPLRYFVLAVYRGHQIGDFLSEYRITHYSDRWECSWLDWNFRSFSLFTVNAKTIPHVWSRRSSSTIIKLNSDGK